MSPSKRSNDDGNAPVDDSKQQQQQPATMTFPLLDLPREVLQRIMVIAGSDTKTLLTLELTCHAFESIIQEDKTWKHVTAPALDALQETIPDHVWEEREPLPRSLFDSNRTYACTMNAIRLCWVEQARKTDNVLVEVLRPTGIFTAPNRNHCDHMCLHCIFGFFGLTTNVGGFYRHAVLRRDSLETLMELVQESVTRVLRRAHDLSCLVHANGRDAYPPVLTVDNIRHTSQDLVPSSLFQEWNVYEPGPLNPTVPDTIVWRLARRAGIVKMTRDAFDLTWEAIILHIRLLVRQACFEVDGINRSALRMPLSAHASIRDIPPPLKLVLPHCDMYPGVRYLNTVVPGQFELAAKSSGLLKYKVYGDFWCAPDDPAFLHWLPAGSNEDDEPYACMAEEDYEFEEPAEDEQEEEDLKMELYEDESYQWTEGVDAVHDAFFYLIDADVHDADEMDNDPDETMLDNDDESHSVGSEMMADEVIDLD